MALDKVKLVKIPVIPDERGNISFFQYPDHIPFEIKKVYWINDVKSGTDRGGQANKDFQELIIALSGSFDVLVNDGKEERLFSLNRPDTYLFIPKMVWRQLLNFSTNSVAFITVDQKHTDDSNSFVDFSEFQSSISHAATF